MLIALHKNARAAPAVRAEIAASSERASILAKRYGITEQTVYKWKKSEVFGVRGATPNSLIFTYDQCDDALGHGH